jgi:KUP system potassium uptake protein
MEQPRITPANVIKSMGLVFGDIGTSPIYTLAVVFMLTGRTEAHFLGILSLIVWTLLLLVTVEYAWLAMSLSKGGEGGTIVLLSLLRPLLRSGRSARAATLLAYVGISLLMGDGVITPAISILSAVEGLTLIPGLAAAPRAVLAGLAVAVAVALFSLQRRGSGALAAVFGPVMALWFAVLAVSGLAALTQAPQVLKALNPWYGLDFILHNGLTGFFVLSEVILCATGGEALYADMGHMGRRPILAAWGVVFCALVLNYMGQTAFLIRNPQTDNVLFALIHSQTPLLYIPFLALCLLATVIASQSLISGLFSIMYQSMATHIMPLFKVDYTSPEMHSQIYINTVNWALCLAVVLVICGFGESHRLAAAYGLAVTGSMTITAVFMVWIFRLRRQPGRCALALGICALDVVYLLANFYKLPHGGYWSVVLAAAPLSLILVYTWGQRAVYARMRPMRQGVFLAAFTALRRKNRPIRGTAIFFLRSLEAISPYIVKTIFMNGIMYERSIMLSVTRTFEPLGLEWRLTAGPAPGLSVFEVSAGYMEVVDIAAILAAAGIRPRAIFYGVEDIITNRPLARAYALIKRLAPSFVKFYKLPTHAVHGVVSRVTL